MVDVPLWHFTKKTIHCFLCFIRIFLEGSLFLLIGSVLFDCIVLSVVEVVIELVVIQTCQLSLIQHETHALKALLTLSHFIS